MRANVEYDLTETENDVLNYMEQRIMHEGARYVETDEVADSLDITVEKADKVLESLTEKGITRDLTGLANDEN